ncbi:MAG: hypothetical protein ACK6D7_10435 [Acidobacteriota bacterium]
MRAGLVFALLPALWAGALPHVVRVAPLGGQAGTTVEVEFRGTGLGRVRAVEFDTPELAWLGATAATEKSVKGRVRIGAGAALGPHRVRLITEAGPANTRLFNVNQFPGVEEVEPVTAIELRPQVVHGEMGTLADQDFLKFRGRWWRVCRLCGLVRSGTMRGGRCRGRRCGSGERRK